MTFSPNASWQSASVLSKSARGWSSRVIATARGMPTLAHSSQSAAVAGSMPPSLVPPSADTTKSAASAARRPARSSPTKSA